MSLFAQHRHQFILEHGDFIWVESWRGFIFEDGASMGEDSRGPYEGPPRTQDELAQRRVMYHKAYLQRAVAKFEELKARLEQTGLAAQKSGGRVPTDEEFSELKRLQADVATFRKKLEAVQARPAQAKATATRAAATSQHQQAASEMLNKLRSVRV